MIGPAAHDELQAMLDFTLASLLAAHPEGPLEERLGALLEEGAAPGAAFVAPLGELLRGQGGVERLAASYVDLFDRGGQRSSLHETEHGRMRGMSKGHDLADIAGFYAAFGLAISDEAGSRELPDHLAVELQFYGTLVARQSYLEDHGDACGVAIVLDARRKFLADHLGPLADAVARLPAVRADPIYGPILGWCAELVTRERAALDVGIVPLELREAPPEDDDRCGTSLPVVPTASDPRRPPHPPEVE